jgi:flavin-dependent dehydrogenase
MDIGLLEHRRRIARLKSTESADVLVIGAGPAGAAAARLLAVWGHNVLVLDRPGSDAGRLAESIPSSADKVLRAIGALDAVREAGFLPWRGNTVWWADESARVETFPGDSSGYQILRRDFDRCLRDLAVDSGARVEEARVTAAHRDDGSAAWSMTAERAGRSDEYRSRIVIDASGRAGVLARAQLRVLDSERRTVALAGSWMSGRNARPWPIEDDSHTLVASYAGGWAWSVPVDRGIRQFTVMVDPTRSELARDSSSRDVYLAELAKVRPFTPVLAAAHLIEGPWGADASEYTARQYAGPGFLLAGDAGSAINPLSSFGVKKALASGWLAAIAVNTALVNPAMADEAFAFFDRRERSVAAAAARQASQFAEEAAQRTGHPFWLARAEAAGTNGVDVEPDVTALATDPAVLAAFADLRARGSLHVVTGPDVRFARRPVVRGNQIEMEDHLLLPDWPNGLRFLRNVDLVALVRLAPACHDAGEMYEIARRSAPEITLPDFLGALSVLVANGSLRHE